MNYHQSMLEKGIPQRSYNYMEDLDILQYDLLYGKQYAYNGENPYPSTGIQMGIHDIKIDRVYSFGNRVHIFGENFTNWSKVYINGKAADTTYYSGQHLSVSLDDVGQSCTLTVNQMAGDTILRSSNQYTFTLPSDSEEDAS